MSHCCDDGTGRYNTWEPHFCRWPVRLTNNKTGAAKTFWLTTIERMVERDFSRLSSAFAPEEVVRYRAEPK